MVREHFNNILSSGVPPKYLSLPISKFGSKLTPKLSETIFFYFKITQFCSHISHSQYCTIIPNSIRHCMRLILQLQINFMLVKKCSFFKYKLSYQQLREFWTNQWRKIKDLDQSSERFNCWICGNFSWFLFKRTTLPFSKFSVFSCF